MSKRLSSLVAGLIVLGLALTACQAPTPEVVESTVEVPVEQTVEVAVEQTVEVPVEVTAPPEQPSGDITLWVMPNGPDPAAAVEAEIAAFNEVYPDVNVSYEVVGWGDAYGAIQTAVQGGEGPDVTQMGTTWVPTFGTMGGLHTFTNAEIEEVGGADAFVDASWATASIYENVVSLPWFADVRGMFYRTDVFEQAGVDPDEAFATIDNFIAGLEAIAESDQDIAPFVHPGRNDWNVWQNASQWGWAYGGEILRQNEEGQWVAAFNEPEFVAGVTQFVQLYGMGLAPENTLELNSSQAEAEFGQGRAASVMSGAYLIPNFRDLEGSGYSQEVADNYHVAPFPEGPGGRYTFFGGSNLGIMQSTDNFDAAWALVKFLMTPESQVRFTQAIGNMPATREGQSDPAFTEDPQFSVLIEAAPTGKTSTNIPDWGAVENTFNSALQGLWEDVAAADGPIDEEIVQERLDTAAETVNSILAQ